MVGAHLARSCALWLLLLVGLVLPVPAVAQGVGLWIRADCTVITGPVTGQSWCFDSTAEQLKVWNGTAFVQVTGGGGGSPSSCTVSTGFVTISGTATTGSVTLSPAQINLLYTVELGTRGLSGSPPEVLATYNTPTVNGFGVKITAPPGAGNSVAVDWSVNRADTCTGAGGGIAGTAPHLAIFAGPASLTDYAGTGTGGANTFIVSLDASGVATFGSPSAGATVYRQCTVVIGADNGAVLLDADIGPQGRQCFAPVAGTVVQVTVAADGGTPSVLPRKNHQGSTTNLLSGALSTAGSGGVACAKTTGVTGFDTVTTCSATLTTTALAAGDFLELVSGTAGGVAKRMTTVITWSEP